ncbi:MAG: hypothetical protein KTR31_32605 [Myxococcales bacterium]|nr:hypothetical protein [Myxococcales bacterium]
MGACEICDDGIDNDGNSLVDCDDPDCDVACDHVTPFSSELDLVLAAGQTVVLVVDSGDGGNGQIILEVSN